MCTFFLSEFPVCSVRSLYHSILYFRVGTKESGTRFLSYVDSALGYRHLLQQVDLDRALSLCTGMRGKLRSRFIVLSDDRVLPPPPAREPRGKRKKPASESDPGTKRGRSGRRGSTPSGAPPPTTSSKQGPVGAAFPAPNVPMPGATQVPGVSLISGSAQTGVSQVPGVSLISGSAQSTHGYFTSFQNLPGRMTNSLLSTFSVPPPIMEVDNTSSSLSTEDWASANSDDTITH